MYYDWRRGTLEDKATVWSKEFVPDMAARLREKRERKRWGISPEPFSRAACAALKGDLKEH